jgi:hypothetical protein
MTRDCGSCTKCCEGYLSGVAYGKPFYLSNPCHFIEIGKGCTIYAERPKDPCITFHCQWLANPEIPEWLKPDKINAIITKRTVKDTEIEYWDLCEAGETLRANVLTWLIQYALNNKINLHWQVEGGNHWVGDKDFIKAMNEMRKT